MIRKTYAGIPQDFANLETSKIVLIPVSYDGTSTWQKGSDKGPYAFLNASENMELYDIESDSQVFDEGVFLNDILTDFNTPDQMVEIVKKHVSTYIRMNKFVTLVGGEHSVSIGAIQAFIENYKDLTVLHIDAHSDLRKEYNGSKYNHACALHEASLKTNLIQVGIRSMDISEKEYMNLEKVYFSLDMVCDEYWADNALGQMTENVYITFDLDAFDPSILPSTGTPEPGGLFWNETLRFLESVFTDKNVVGFDIMELCPNENEKSSDFLAAKLYYKMLTYKFKLRKYNE
jgi:agmatinase